MAKSNEAMKSNSPDQPKQVDSINRREIKKAGTFLGAPFYTDSGLPAGADFSMIGSRETVIVAGERHYRTDGFRGAEAPDAKFNHKEKTE